MPMPNLASKTLPFAGVISVVLGALSAWVTLVPARIGARNVPVWPFVVAALIALVVVFALAKARKRQRPRPTAPPTFSWGLVIAIMVITALVVMGGNALTNALAAGTLKVTPLWASIGWGLAAGALAGLGMAVVNRAIARAKIN